MSKWISIESAPKDNGDILCYCNDYQIVCSWSDFEDGGSSWCTHAFGRQKGWNDYNYEIHHPTHWMPLPKPPKLQDE